MSSGLMRRGAAVLTTAGVFAALLVVGGTAHAAGTTPPWEPDPSAVGTITLYDSSGNVITSGSTSTAPFFAYAVGSATIRSGDVQASVFEANPNPAAAPSSWFVDTLGGFTTYPVTTGPVNIQTLSQTHPVATGSATDLTLDFFYSEIVHYTATGYTNMVQLRMRTANAAGNQTTTYDDADILINPTAHTFTVTYPTVPAAPTGVTAVAGDQAATVSWTAPATGGSPLTGYALQYSSNGGTTWVNGPAHPTTTTSQVVKGLTNGSPYIFRVAAINAVGRGAFSTPSSAVTPVADPTALTIGKSVTVTKGKSVTITTVLTDSKTKTALAKLTVGLYSRTSTSKPFTLVKSLVTSSTGAASLAQTPTVTTYYQWRFAGTAAYAKSTSAIQTVTVTG